MAQKWRTSGAQVAHKCVENMEEKRGKKAFIGKAQRRGKEKNSAYLCAFSAKLCVPL